MSLLGKCRGLYLLLLLAGHGFSHVYYGYSSARRFFLLLHNKAFEHLKECHRHLHSLSQERQHTGADEAPKQQQQTIIIEYKG
jgi:hypothetical protein